MKRDMGLIRELLLRLEAVPVKQDGIVGINAASKEVAIEGYELVQIAYHISLLMEVGFIETAGRQLIDGTIAFRRLTWAGHDYLDAVRDPEIWRKTKQGAEAAGGFTLDLVKELATGFIKKKIEEHTGVKL